MIVSRFNIGRAKNRRSRGGQCDGGLRWFGEGMRKDRAVRLASHLHGLKLGSGKRIAFCLPRHFNGRIKVMLLKETDEVAAGERTVICTRERLGKRVAGFKSATAYTTATLDHHV